MWLEGVRWVVHHSLSDIRWLRCLYVSAIYSSWCFWLSVFRAMRCYHTSCCSRAKPSAKTTGQTESNISPFKMGWVVDSLNKNTKIVFWDKEARIIDYPLFSLSIILKILFMNSISRIRWWRCHIRICGPDGDPWQHLSGGLQRKGPRLHCGGTVSGQAVPISSQSFQ